MGIWTMFAKGSPSRCFQTTLPLAGPAPCGRCLARDGSARASSWLGSPRITHPVYPPGPHPVYPPWYPPGTHDTHTAADRDQHRTTGTCTYGRSEAAVGEPRGVEYRGVQALFGLFWHCLALYWPCIGPQAWCNTSVLLSLGPVLLILGPV